MKNILLVIFFLLALFNFSLPAYSCDLNLLEILTLPCKESKEFSTLISRIASNTKTLNLELAGFVEKNQEYYFPPRRINGKDVSSHIDIHSVESDAFFQRFCEQLKLTEKSWNELKTSNSLYPAWVEKDKAWEQKCKDIDSCFKDLHKNLGQRNFHLLHDFIANLYSSLLSLLEFAQNDVVQRTLLAISKDVMLLVHGVELNRISEIELASRNLTLQTDHLKDTLASDQQNLLENFALSVRELQIALQENQLNTVVEAAGKIELHFGKLTEELSAKYPFEKTLFR